MPLRVPMKISLVPSVSCTAITASPSSMPIAMMPPARGLLNADSSVFLIVPLRVPITMKLVVVELAGPPASRRSSRPSSIDTRLAIDLPLPSAPTSGISWTFSQ